MVIRTFTDYSSSDIFSIFSIFSLFSILYWSLTYFSFSIYTPGPPDITDHVTSYGDFPKTIKTFIL